MIKIAHECPKRMFEIVQRYTDIDYALVNLLDEDEEYLNLFRQAKKKGREIILDNSVFELEKSYDPDRFLYWINELTPDWYIVPDVLEDMEGTMEQMAQWNRHYKDKAVGRKVGVVQGKTYEELVDCYRYMDLESNVDMIAISFDYSYYLKSFSHPNRYASWTLGRVKLLGDFVKDGVINENKKHHLLGVSLPFEGSFYQHYPWIYSIDTSNPIVAGIKGKKYVGDFGLLRKEKQKLISLIDKDPIRREKVDAMYNLEKFREYWNSMDRAF